MEANNTIILGPRYLFYWKEYLTGTLRKLKQEVYKFQGKIDELLELEPDKSSESNNTELVDSLELTQSEGNKQEEIKISEIQVSEKDDDESSLLSDVGNLFSNIHSGQSNYISEASEINLHQPSSNGHRIHSGVSEYTQIRNNFKLNAPFVEVFSSKTIYVSKSPGFRVYKYDNGAYLHSEDISVLDNDMSITCMTLYDNQSKISYIDPVNPKSIKSFDLVTKEVTKIVNHPYPFEDMKSIPELPQDVPDSKTPPPVLVACDEISMIALVIKRDGTIGKLSSKQFSMSK